RLNLASLRLKVKDRVPQCQLSAFQMAPSMQAMRATRKAPPSEQIGAQHFVSGECFGGSRASGQKGSNFKLGPYRTDKSLAMRGRRLCFRPLSMQKTKKSIAKRFKLTARGKLVRRTPGFRHL